MRWPRLVIRVSTNLIEGLKLRIPDKSAQQALIQKLSELEARLRFAREVIAFAPARRQEVLVSNI